MLSYVEFDNKIPVYREINETIHQQLAKDRIHYSRYMDFVSTLGEYHKLRNKLIKISNNTRISQATNVTKEQLDKVEKSIFDFVSKTSNPYVYLLSPYYIYKYGKKYANMPEISTDTGYIKANGTGIETLALTSRYALFSLGIKLPEKTTTKKEEVVTKDLRLFDDYDYHGDNIYF